VKLHHLMQLDTCPMCGREIWAEENKFLGVQNLEDIPIDTEFRIQCKDERGNQGCGYFSITRIVPLPDSEWKCEYFVTGWLP
jgi:hypothetical protein